MNGSWGENIQIWYIDRCISFFSNVVREQSDIGVLPAEEIVDEHYCCISIRPCDIGPVAGRWEFDYFAFWLPVPLKSFDAAGVDRHLGGNSKSLQSVEGPGQADAFSFRMWAENFHWAGDNGAVGDRDAEKTSLSHIEYACR